MGLSEEPMDWNRLVRLPAIVGLTLAGLALFPGAASAQEVTEDYIVNHLGPAAEEMQWAGVDGSGESAPAIIEISQRWGIEPAYWISVDEVRALVRAEREDRVRERYASFVDPLNRYPSRLTLARFGIVKVGLTCAQAQQKAREAQRLADTLSRVSQLDAVGTGLVGALSGGAVRFAAPLGFATLVTGMASLWASQLANSYRNAPCLTGGDPWRFRPNLMKASLSPNLSPVPCSSPGPSGLAYAALHIRRTFKPLAVEPRSCSRSGTGPSRSL
jgi:hypothetical protein